MDRLVTQNNRLHDQISKLKDDLSRHIQKDELVSQTFDLNATQMGNMTTTIDN